MSTDFKFRHSIAWLALVGLFSCWLATNSFAQSDSNPFIFGKVQNSSGEPAASAQVWLVGWDDVERYDDPPKILSQTVCNSSGEYSFDLKNGEELFRNPGQLTVWASNQSGELGWFNGLYQYRQKSLTIKLNPTKSLNGKIVDANGKPIANASLSPNRLFELPFNEPNRRVGVCSEAARKELTTTTNQEGKFTIEGVPSGGAISLDIDMPGFSELTLYLNAANSVVVKLDAGLPLTGEILDPAGKSRAWNTQIGELTFKGFTHHDATGAIVEDKADSSYLVRTSYEANIDTSGKFQLAAISPGKYRVTAELAKRVRMLLPNDIQLNVKPNKLIDDFEIESLPAVKISGRVVGAIEKQPVAGAKVQIMSLFDGRLRYLKRVETDSDGMYFAFVGPATHLIKVAETPEAYIPSGDSSGSELGKKRMPQLEVTKDTVWPDLEVDPAQDMTIEVFDENGKPAVGAVVKIVTMAGYPTGRDYQTVQKTDKNGKYVIRRVTSNDTLPIRVYSPSAISDPTLVITPSEHKTPLRIDLSPDNGVRLKCRVVDRAGDPIANATVLISTNYPQATKWLDSGLWLSGGAGRGRTDDNGNFVSGPVWDDLQYSLNVIADGYEKGQSPRLKVEGKKLVEFKPITLSKTKVVSVAGTVVDADKRPLAGVSVYAAGESYQLARTRTNSQGKFNLDGLASDVRYVFADNKDYRFGGARISNKPVEISLRKYNDPPKGVRSLRESDREVRFETAKELLELAWELPISKRNTSRMGILEAMSKVDESQAMKMSVQGGANFNYVIQKAKSKKLLETDTEQAIQLLRTLPNRTAIFTSLELAKRAATASRSETDKKTAKKLLDFATEVVKKETQYFSRLAVIYTLIGEHEKAKELNAIVAKQLDVNAINEDQEWQAEFLATALAPYDFEKAQAFASASGSIASQTYALSDVALAILSSDQKKSLAEIEKLSGDSNAPNIRDRARYRAAFQLIETDPELAIELVYQCEESDNRAQALGRLAVEVAKTDKAKACKMIDDALTIHRGDSSTGRGWSNFGGAGPFVAALAYQANSIGYPDMESVVWQVRAACRANGKKGQERVSATINTARILALVDKFAARDLLNSIAVSTDQIPRENYGVSLYDRWLQAWLLVDYSRGASFIREELLEMKEAGKENPLRYGHGDVFRLLVAAPQDRFKLLMNESGLWRLEVDGTDD